MIVFASGFSRLPPVASGGMISGTFTTSNTWTIPSFLGTYMGWVEEEPDLMPRTAQGVVIRVAWELDHGLLPERPKGILMHAITWHLICQLPPASPSIVKPQGYLAGLPVRTTFDMPEWEWVYAWGHRKIKVPTTDPHDPWSRVTNDLDRLTGIIQANRANRGKSRVNFDTKSVSIQAKARR